MIKRLRRRFVLTNMLLVSVVLLAVFCAVGASTVHQLSTENDIALRAELMHAAGGDAQKLFIGPARERPKEQREALLPTFSVTLDAEGNILRLNAQAVEISSEDAASAVAQALAAGGSAGSPSSPALRFLREGSNIAFVSREHEISAVWRFLLTSALVGVSSLAAFFLSFASPDKSASLIIPRPPSLRLISSLYCFFLAMELKSPHAAAFPSRAKSSHAASNAASGVLRMRSAPFGASSSFFNCSAVSCIIHFSPAL